MFNVPSADPGAFCRLVVEIFPARFSRQHLLAAIGEEQAAAVQPSGASGPDGSTHDEGPASEVSLSPLERQAQLTLDRGMCLLATRLQIRRPSMQDVVCWFIWWIIMSTCFDFVTQEKVK